MRRLSLAPTATIPLLAVLAWGLTATCPAPVAAQGTADREATLVQQRARDLWNAKVTDRWDVVFDLLPPEEQAQTQGREAYAEYQKSGGPFQYTAAEVGEVVVEGDTAWVALKFAVKPRQYPLKPSDVEKWEVWIKRDDWRPVPRSAEDQFASRPPKARNAEEDARLAARVEAVWKATASDDWRAVYDFLDPTYRAANSIEQHMARRAKYRYSSPRIQWVETNGNTGRAKVSFMQKLNDPTLTKLEPEEKSMVEQWLKVNGQWFRNTKPAQESR